MIMGEELQLLGKTNQQEVTSHMSTNQPGNMQGGQEWYLSRDGFAFQGPPGMAPNSPTAGMNAGTMGAGAMDGMSAGMSGAGMAGMAGAGMAGAGMSAMSGTDGVTVAGGTNTASEMNAMGTGSMGSTSMADGTTGATSADGAGTSAGLQSAIQRGMQSGTTQSSGGMTGSSMPMDGATSMMGSMPMDGTRSMMSGSSMPMSSSAGMMGSSMPMGGTGMGMMGSMPMDGTMSSMSGGMGSMSGGMGSMSGGMGGMSSMPGGMSGMSGMGSMSGYGSDQRANPAEGDFRTMANSSGQANGISAGQSGSGGGSGGNGGGGGGGGSRGGGGQNQMMGNRMLVGMEQANTMMLNGTIGPSSQYAQDSQAMQQYYSQQGMLPQTTNDGATGQPLMSGGFQGLGSMSGMGGQQGQMGGLPTSTNLMGVNIPTQNLAAAYFNRYPTAYGQPVVAVRKGSGGRGRGQIQAFMLSDGRVLDYAQMLQASMDGMLHGIVCQANREGELILRSVPDPIEQNNLDNLPQF